MKGPENSNRWCSEFLKIKGRKEERGRERRGGEKKYLGGKAAKRVCTTGAANMQTSLHLTLLTAFMKFLRECVLWEEVKSSKKKKKKKG